MSLLNLLIRGRLYGGFGALLLFSAALIALPTGPAIAGPCDVAGAIPNCEAILSGKVAPAPYADSSKLNFGTSNPQEHEITSLSYGPDARAIARANAQSEDARQQYANGIEMRGLHGNLEDAQRHLDLVVRGIYKPMGN
jgi:hypothetical protein